ncbi:MAG: hypothetical protein LZF86_50147 [Nitrospira sp.]|nr:MAG: hypothetical protein LZF86_50147 [Nitrospira sp.]
MDRTRRYRSRKHPDLYRRASADYADAIVEQLILSVDQLEALPESGRRVPESADPKILELLVESYRIIYLIFLLGELKPGRWMKSNRPARFIGPVFLGK